jgi:RNA polymerase-interacting CarD/CdnL/TRCF family regulator
MFQKKQYIYSETQGACIVDNIVQLPAGKGETVPYYVLKSVFDATKVSYIPVRNHQVVLRELFTREEALEMKKDSKLEKDEKRKAAVEFVLQKESE